MNNGTIRKKACYLCTTPLQVMGAINLELYMKQGADIFLFDDFNDYQNIGVNLVKAQIFQNVYCVDFYSSLKTVNKKLMRAKIFVRMAACNRYITTVVEEAVSYDYMYCSTSAVSKMVVANALFNLNHEMKAVRYDEGIGSYSNNEKGRKGSSLFQKAKAILGWRDLIEEAETIYLYQPQLAKNNNIEIRRMPTIPLTDQNKRMLYGIFCGDVKKDCRINEKVILFDTVRKINEYTETLQRLDSSYEGIVKNVGESNVILKPHPRSTDKAKVDVRFFEDGALPIEMVYMQQEDLSEKILIAFNSTAVFTPKMLFDSEPHIILLYRLVSDDQVLMAKRDATYLKMVEMYTERERVFIPNTLEELVKMLAMWMS